MVYYYNQSTSAATEKFFSKFHQKKTEKYKNGRQVSLRRLKNKNSYIGLQIISMFLKTIKKNLTKTRLFCALFFTSLPSSQTNKWNLSSKVKHFFFFYCGNRFKSI